MNLGDFAQAAAQIFSSYERGTVDVSAPRRVADQLGQWLGHLSRNAAIHWSPNIADPEQCSFCDSDAVTDCIACGDACCVAHAHISHRAEAICDECVQKLLSQSEKKRRRQRRQRPHAASPPRDAHADVAQAFVILGVQPGAPWETVQMAYKAAAVANHPDRFQGVQREQAEVRLKTINAAFNVLKSHYQRAA